MIPRVMCEYVINVCAGLILSTAAVKNQIHFSSDYEVRLPSNFEI